MRALFLPYRTASGWVLLLLAACGGSGPSGDPPPVDQVVVAPATATLETGSQVQLTATLTDAGGGTLTDRPIAWSSSAEGIATVTDKLRTMAALLRRSTDSP